MLLHLLFRSISALICWFPGQSSMPCRLKTSVKGPQWTIYIAAKGTITRPTSPIRLIYYHSTWNCLSWHVISNHDLIELSIYFNVCFLYVKLFSANVINVSLLRGCVVHILRCLTGSGVDAKMMAVIMKYTTRVQHKCKTPWINITKKKKIHFSCGGLHGKKNGIYHYNRWYWSMRLEIRIDGTFRRWHSLCPSEASDLAPSLVSLPPPWVWPGVKATITHLLRNATLWTLWKNK